MKFKKTILIISTLAILPTITVYAKERLKVLQDTFLVAQRKNNALLILKIVITEFL